MPDPIELPEGVERFSPQIAGATDEGFLPMDEIVDGAYIRYSDLPIIIAQEREKWEAEQDGSPRVSELTDLVRLGNEALSSLQKAEAERDQAQEALERERNRRAGRISENRDQIKAQALAGLREGQSGSIREIERIRAHIEQAADWLKRGIHPPGLIGDALLDDEVGLRVALSTLEQEGEDG